MDSSAATQKFATPTAQLTTLSLATKSSYKDKKSGEFVAHTEWHRCVNVYGKLAEFAATLTKGTHAQIEGELRSREIAARIRTSSGACQEIRVDSILKLDRAEKAGLKTRMPGGNRPPRPVLLYRRLIAMNFELILPVSSTHRAASA